MTVRSKAQQQRLSGVFILKQIKLRAIAMPMQVPQIKNKWDESRLADELPSKAQNAVWLDMRFATPHGDRMQDRQCSFILSR
jgi:hypothetical protein